MSSARSIRPVAAALAMMLVAGSAAPAWASNNTSLVSGRAKGVSTLALQGGAPFRTTQAAVKNHRLIHVANSSVLVALWDEVSPTGAVEHFYGLSLDRRTFAQVNPTSYQVRLVYSQFDPKQGEPAVLADLAAPAQSRVYLVQFEMPPIDEFRREIGTLGGTVERFLTDHTHVVSMDAAAAAEVAKLPYVRWVGRYHPAYRLSPEVRSALIAAGPDAAAERYSIECFRRGMGQQSAVADAIRAMGGIVEVTTRDQFRLEATLTPAQVRAVAAMNEVNYIDPWGGPGGTDMDIIRQLVGAVPTLSGLNFLGQGVRGEVFDTEVITNHVQWAGQAPLIHGVNGNSGLHGTSCYGINFATGTGDVTATGLLPQREQGIFYHYPQSTQFGGGQTRLAANMQATSTAGPFFSAFQTSSVGSAQITNYSTISAETDDYLFQVDYLSCQSQSNTGSQLSRPQAWAKNIVSVGGIQHNNTLTRADDGASGASFGPAADGRTKPDISNCYDAIHTTDGSSATSYTDFGGTSGATPITAGCFGLLAQMWHQQVFQGFGGAATVFASRSKANTAKVMLINTAYRYPIGQLNRARQGWGVADVANLYNSRTKLLIVNETDVLENAQTKVYNVAVDPATPELAVTMAFSDPAGNPAAAQARINDLSLKVTAPDGSFYWGNNGLGINNASTAGGVANTIDTVENVFINNPLPGNWTIEVTATSLVQDGRPETPGLTDADFALVARGVRLGPPPALTIVLPSGIPGLIAPQTPTDIAVSVFPGSQNVVPGSPAMLYRMSGSGSFTLQQLISLGGTNYKATLPGAVCGATPQMYFTASGDTGAIINLPSTAPAAFYSTTIGTIQTTTVTQIDLAGSSFPTGWTASGLWHMSSLCVPGGTPCAGAQWAYYGQDSNCTYNTGVTNTGTLTAPSIALPSIPAGGSITMTYCSALTTENLSPYDAGTVLVNGTPVDTAGQATSWETRTVDLSSFSGQTVTLAFKFDTVDGSFNDFRGWQIDNIKITASSAGCTSTCYANCDGSSAAPILNVNDFVCFNNRFAAGDSYANCDGSTSIPVLNVNDFVCFNNLFAAGCS